jgi:hypothetical protein
MKSSEARLLIYLIISEEVMLLSPLFRSLSRHEVRIKIRTIINRLLSKLYNFMFFFFRWRIKIIYFRLLKTALRGLV